MPVAVPFTHAEMSLVAEALTESPGPLRVLVLHGWAHGRENTRPLATALAPLGEVWALDLPGHGTATVPKRALNPADMADLVEAWLATLPPMPLLIVGHSMGFRVAAHLGARKGTNVVGLVAVAGAGVPRPLTLKKRLRRKGIQLALAFAKRFKGLLGEGLLQALRRRFGSADYRAVSAAMRPTFLGMVNDDITPLAPQITAPTLLIYGTADTETPPELGEKLKALLPNARLLVLPHQTHTSLLEAGRHLVAREILAFAQPLTAPGGR